MTAKCVERATSCWNAHRRVRNQPGFQCATVYLKELYLHKLHLILVLITERIKVMNGG